MAFTSPTARGQANSTASSTTLTVTLNANVVVGKLLIAGCVSATVGAPANGATTTHTVSDPQHGNWTRHGEYSTGNATSGAGTTVSIHSKLITTEIKTSNLVTLTTSGNATDKEIGLMEASYSGQTVALQEIVAGAANAITVSSSTLPSDEYLAFYVGGARGSDTSKGISGVSEVYDTRSGTGTNTAMHIGQSVWTGTNLTATSSTWTYTMGRVLMAQFIEINSSECISITESESIS
jgi:hypothetical protein